MTHIRYLLAVLILTAVPLLARAQRTPPREAILTYKDGFTLTGRVNEKIGTTIFDRESGRAFAVPSGEFYIDDLVRNVLFSPGQILEVKQLKPPPGARQPMVVKRVDFVGRGKVFQPSWLLNDVSDWNSRGERIAKVQVRASGLVVDMNQRMALITPRFLRALTAGYDWDVYYFTSEFGPQKTRDLLLEVFSERKEYKGLSDSAKLYQLAIFMEEAGWYVEAEKELTRSTEKEAPERLIKLIQLRNNSFVESIEKAAALGQHGRAINRLDLYDRQDRQALVSRTHQLMAQDLKVKYEKSRADIAQVQAHLKFLPALTAVPKTWVAASSYIADELNHDTIDRLQTFLDFADQYADARKKNRKPSQSAEEVLSMAISSWLQGKQAADPDPVNAIKLARARQFVLGSLASDNANDRTSMQVQYKADGELPMDMLVRLVRMIPPSHPFDVKKLSTDVIPMTVEVPEAQAGSYLLKLPPDYHHQRAYPVLMLLPTGREKAEDMLEKFAEEAANLGFILAAPVGKLGKAVYQYGAADRAQVIDTLRDLRRRFQIDSDRVFLFGWDEGGSMAFDVGLAHPDQFAGVAVMNGTITPFARRFYWPNARYLPFYVIEGDRNFENTKVLRDLFKDWRGDPYALTYMEYNGRGTEWYSAEIPSIMSWMKGKKRHHPTKAMGRLNLGIGLGEEFHSTRPGDNRFYWLSTEGIGNANLADHRLQRWDGRFRPATFEAHRTVGNEKDSKGGARIWNEITLNVTGVRQVTLSFPANMMDFTKPLKLRVNGTIADSNRMILPSVETLLDELQSTGDRQRLIVAKLPMRL